MTIEYISEYPFILAFLLGILPALIWLWFWIKEDSHPEPLKMLTLSFVGGMLAVVFVLPFQKIVYFIFQNHQILSNKDLLQDLEFLIWAALEEIFKFGFVYFIALRNKVTDEPVDDIIYLIVAALGFVTLENTLFLLEPIRNGEIINTIVTSNMRFLGASLLHTMSSATIGICMGLSFYKTKAIKREYLIFGVILAILLHTAFNLFIMNEAGGNIFLIFGTVWICIIVLLLLFEKVKTVEAKRG
jgi:RsiW-degrading membrane proteinase PrsW (M82 family)